MKELEEENVSEMVAFFADRLNLVFAYFFCVIEFAGEKDASSPPTIGDARCLGLRIIESACLHTTLTALRDVDDVLSLRRKQKPTDLRVSDFGYSNSLHFLTEEERTRINTEIVHSTHLVTTTLRGWDLLEMTTKCIRQSVAFFNWVEKNGGYSGAIVCRNGIESTYDYVARKLKEMQMIASL